MPDMFRCTIGEAIPPERIEYRRWAPTPVTKSYLDDLDEWRGPVGETKLEEAEMKMEMDNQEHKGSV